MSVDTAAIRQLLVAAFNDEDLRIFCYDHFREVAQQFTAGQTQGERIQGLIEHVDRHNALDRLLMAIQQDRPAQWKTFAPRLASTLPGPSSPVLTTRPPTPPHVFGREAERQQAVAALHQGEVVLLHGLGGLGKTTLAADVATRLREEGAFPGGVVWVGDVGAAPLDAICDAVARQLGDQTIPRLVGGEKYDAVRALLADAGPLVVLDDVADPATGRAFLERCRPAGLALLLTSRERVLVPEADDDVLMAPLGRDDAIALFRERARTPTGEDGAVGAVCEALGDHPLALAVAAGQVRSGAATLAGLRRRLGAALHRVSALQLGPDKQHNVWVSLEASISTLAPEQLKVLTRLAACFGESAGPALLALACGLPAGECDELVGALVLRSLAEREGERARLHPLVRDFAREAAGGGLPAARAAVVAAALAYAEPRHGRREPADHDRLEGELGTLVGAVEHAAARGDWSGVLALAGPLVSDSRVCAIRGYWAEQVLLGRRGIEAARRLGDERALAGLLHNTAITLADRGELVEARRLYEEALESFRSLDDQRGVAQSLSQLGTLAQRAGDDAGARQLYEESLALKRGLGDQRGVAYTLHQLGTLAQRAGDDAGARQLYEESLAHFERIGSPDAATARLSLLRLDEAS